LEIGVFVNPSKSTLKFNVYKREGVASESTTVSEK